MVNDAPSRIPILMYHEVALASEIEPLAHKIGRGYIVLRDRFAEHMAFLKDAGFAAISLPELWRWSRGECALPVRPIVISFDDGYVGNFTRALPVLTTHGLTATFFIVTNKVGTPHMLDWPQLREMRAQGMSIQSHTANHPLLSTLNEADTRAELASSKRAIEEKLGAPVEFLSLPNGDSNRHYANVAQECGYRGGCSSIFGFNERGTDVFFWKRIAMKKHTTLENFRRLVVQEPGHIALEHGKAVTKSLVARVIGKRSYHRIYKAVFGVEGNRP